jgi:hypothetical protein
MSDFKLPDSPTVPETDIQKVKGLLYGVPKIGKTTFFSKADAIYADTDNGTIALSVYSVPITTWAQFLDFCAALIDDKRWNTVVIDTVDNLYQQCLEDVCKKHGCTHPSDKDDFGKTWGLVTGEFKRALTKLAQGPRGLWLVSHAQDVTIKTRSAEINKAVPTITGKAREFLLGFCDIILYAEMLEVKGKGLQRVIHADPSENWEAGDRMRRLSAVMPLDWDSVTTAFKGDK